MSLNTTIIFCDSCGSSSFPETTYSLTSCGGVACQNCLPTLTASCSKCRPCTHIFIDKKMRSEAKLYFTDIQELQKQFNSATKYQLNRHKLLHKQQRQANQILLGEIVKLREKNRQQKRLMAQQMEKFKQQQQPHHAVELQQNYYNNNNNHGRSNESFGSVSSHVTGVSKNKHRPKYNGGFHMPNLDMQPPPSRAKSVVSRKSIYSPPFNARNQVQVQPPSPDITYQSIPIHYQASQHPTPYLGPPDHWNQGNYAPSVISRISSRKSGRSSKKTISNIQIFQ